MNLSVCLSAIRLDKWALSYLIIWYREEDQLNSTFSLVDQHVERTNTFSAILEIIAWNYLWFVAVHFCLSVSTFTGLFLENTSSYSESGSSSLPSEGESSFRSPRSLFRLYGRYSKRTKAWRTTSVHRYNVVTRPPTVRELTDCIDRFAHSRVPRTSLAHRILNYLRRSRKVTLTEVAEYFIHDYKGTFRYPIGHEVSLFCLSERIVEGIQSI